MEFDKSRVYTALNADELKVGSQVIVGDSILELKNKLRYGGCIRTLGEISGEDKVGRFRIYGDAYALAYLISEPEEKKLKWTDLKIGDVLKHKKEPFQRLVTAIDSRTDEEYHILAGDLWCDDERLADWEKV